MSLFTEEHFHLCGVLSYLLKGAGKTKHPNTNSVDSHPLLAGQWQLRPKWLADVWWYRSSVFFTEATHGKRECLMRTHNLVISSIRLPQLDVHINWWSFIITTILTVLLITVTFTLMLFLTFMWVMKYGRDYSVMIV